MAKRDIIETITARIEEALNNGTAPWVRPWRQLGIGTGCVPININSAKQYRGINVWMLMLEAQEKGYSSNLWGTYKQFKARGGHVRKDEKSTPIVFWKFGKKIDTDKETGEETHSTWAMARQYNVFNLDQTEDVKLPKKFVVEVPETVEQSMERLTVVDDFAAAVGITIEEGGDTACYIPSHDMVRIPAFDQFETPDKFAVTLLHELTHATGAKKRLDRLKHARFGSTEYAKEELVAECGSAMMAAILGVDVDNIDHHASYLTSWLKALEGDRKFLVSAFSQAQKAVDWLMEAAGMVEVEDTTTEQEAA